MADSDNTTTLPPVTLGRETQSPLTKEHPKPSADPAVEDRRWPIQHLSCPLPGLTRTLQC